MIYKQQGVIKDSRSGGPKTSGCSEISGSRMCSVSSNNPSSSPRSFFAHLEHVELLRRVVVQASPGLVHPVRCPLDVLDEESQAAKLLLRAALIADGGCSRPL